MNWYRWGRKKQVIRDFQRFAASARNLQLGDGRHFIVWWWCRWFYGAILGRSGLGDEKWLMMLNYDTETTRPRLWSCSVRKSWDVPLQGSSGSLVGRQEGRKETLSQHWPLSSLCMLKQSVALVCSSAEGLVWPLWMSIASWQQERSPGLQDTSGWGGLVHLKVWHKAVMLRLLFSLP